MKKTLKILMAIILFAVVLTIATSVNAVAGDTDNPYDDLQAAATAEAKVTDEDARLVKQAGNVYTVQEDLFLKNLNAPNGAIIIIAGEKTLTVKEKVVIDNTVTIATDNLTATKEGTFTTAKGTQINKGGVVYTNLAAFAPVNYGKVYSSVDLKADPANNTELTLVEESIVNKPAVDGKDSDYKYLYVPTTDVVVATGKLSINLKITVPGETQPATKIESPKKYNYEVTAKYGNYELDLAVMTPTVAKYSGTEKTTKDFTVTAGTAGEGTIDIPTGLVDGDPIVATVTVAGKSVDFEYKVGVAPVNPDDNKPEQPENPADTNKPADKGDLDESPKTGDHIIPAATLLAVVVVANVVYFAKSKNN